MMKRYFKSVTGKNVYGEERTVETPIVGRIIKDVVGFIFAFSLLMGSFYINMDYEKTIVTRVGEISRTTGPGLNFKIPFAETAYTADMRIEEINVPFEVATKDNQIIGVVLTLNHRINGTDDGDLTNLYKQFGGNYDYESRLLRKMAVDRTKSVLGTKNIDVIIPERDSMGLAALAAVKSESVKYGIEIIDLQLSKIEFSPKYRDNLDAVAKARAAASEAKQASRREGFLADKP